MNKHLLLTCAILLVACGSGLQAQVNPAFPALTIDKAAIRSLDKAEQLYEKGNFKRAYFIYRNELAPIGDKYAQYMVGYMHLTGQATDADRVVAAAWYRLAAERGTREFVQVHDQLIVSLTPEQLEEHDRVFRDLRKHYGDLHLLMRAVRQDYAILRQGTTGSRLGAGSSSVVVIDMRNRAAYKSGGDYYAKIESRLKSRLELIAQYMQGEGVDIDIDSISLEELEARVYQVLESAD